MPVYRTPDGRIVEERTKQRPLRDSRTATSSQDERTTVSKVEGDAPPPPQSSHRGYSDPTVVHVSRTKSTNGGPGGTPPDDETTRLHGSIGGSASGAKGASPEVEPVAGWLVVVDRPGTGTDLRIGIGQNVVGRDPENRIGLAFGDRKISRRDHLRVNYDHERRVFSVVPGTSANLAYLNGTAIEQRCVLAAGDTIRIGRTTLRFVAFCGDDFNWPDED